MLMNGPLPLTRGISFYPVTSKRRARNMDTRNHSQGWNSSSAHISPVYGPSASSSSHIATDGQSASSPWYRDSFGAHDQSLIFFVWQLLSFFFMQGALSDERTGLYFAVQSLTG
jgi:hypothetical protein